MMSSSALIRQRGAQDFESFYGYACATQGTAPVPAVTSNLNRGVLDFNGDVISLPDWTPILSALTINKQLQEVSIRSCYLSGLGSQAFSKASSRKKTPAIHSKSMTFQLCRALQKCLCVSPNLKTLQIHGLSLRERDLNMLTKGLAKSVSLEHLSLAHCPIADAGLEAVCQSVKFSTTIRTVNFTSCNITWKGAEHMANIIKHQAMKRHTVAWAESLRYRKAEFEAMGGLRRITFNDNILIGDSGVTALAQELTEDLWVKAVDLQRCGISNEGARVLVKMLQSNSTLCVLDIRRNPLVDNELVKAVIKKVLMNTRGQDSQYLWLKPPAKGAHEQSSQVAKTGARRACTVEKPCRASSVVCGRRPPPPGSSARIPWRTAARAQLQRGLPQGASTANQSFQNASSIRITMETESQSESEDAESSSQRVHTHSRAEPITSTQFRRLQANYKRLQVELEESRHKLAEERKARLEANSRLVELELENGRLRSLNQSLSEAHVSHSVLEDEHVLDSIELSFQKFHAFLDLLKDAGLGQLASEAGIKQADFGVLGRPQLSSTGREGQGDKGRAWTQQDTAITGNPQRAPRLQPSRPSSGASAASKYSHHSPSPQEATLTRAVGPSASPPPEQRLSSPTPSFSRASISEKGRGSRSSKSGSSTGNSNGGRVSTSCGVDFSEDKGSPALSSGSSTVSQFGSGKRSDSDGRRDAVGWAGY